MTDLGDLPATSSRRAYVVTYGYTPFVVFFVPLAIAIAAFFLFGVVLSVRRFSLERSSDVLETLVLVVMFVGSAVFFGGAGLSYLVAAVTGRLALRVDSSGVTLGRAFLPTSAVFVPWRDIEHIVRFAASNGAGTAQFIGVRLKPGAALPAGVPAPGSIMAKLRRLNAGFTPWPADLFRNTRGWSLDDSLLSDMVRLHTSHVRIVWAGTRGYLG
jgi:hypothetical protein